MQQKIQLCSIRTNHCKVGCALPRGCRMPLGLSGQGNIWGITYLYMYSTCMCVKGVRRPGWGMMLRWWRVTRYRREHHELTHSSLRFEWCCMPFLTAPHTGTYCNTLLHTATHCCRRGTTWNETVFNEVSNMGSSLTSRAHNFGINTKSLGLSVKVESNKLQHCCLHWDFWFQFSVCDKRRLDGGIAVNVCNHIHEACAAETWRGDRRQRLWPRRRFSIVGTCSLGSLVKKPRDRSLIPQYRFNKRKQHTVYTKHVHMRFNLNKRWVLFKHSELKLVCSWKIDVWTFEWRAEFLFFFERIPTMTCVQDSWQNKYYQKTSFDTPSSPRVLKRRRLTHLRPQKTLLESLG